MGVKVVGTGHYLPEQVVTNDGLVEMGIETTAQWILERTGIASRHRARSNECTSDLAARAAREALQVAGASIGDVRTLICATSSGDYPLPATAHLVQRQLGGSGGAFDINGVCSGFVHALEVGFALCEQSRKGLVLVIGADTYSRWTSNNDRQTSVFFGDGAGAVLLAPTDHRSWLRASISGSDGAGYDRIIVPMGGSRRPATPEGLAAGEMHLKMDGKAVWNFVASRIPVAVQEVVTSACLQMDDIDLIIPHQANLRLLEYCGKALGVSMDRIWTNLERYGNTAAASIPIALHEARQMGRLAPGSNVVLVGFGGGLSWSAVCLRWGADEHD